ncbi:hypothetical protein DXG01_011015 [Tephrocybe rancida]|nr:hypothetical protein DXG01_011015 [Tephrocybe rancida]
MGSPAAPSELNRGHLGDAYSLVCIPCFYYSRATPVCSIYLSGLLSSPPPDLYPALGGILAEEPETLKSISFILLNPAPTDRNPPVTRWHPETKLEVKTAKPLVDARDSDDQSMFEKVDLYLADRPKDGYDTYVDSLDTSSRRGNRYAELPSDPSIEHPLNTRMAHLSAEDMKNKLKELNPLHQEIFCLWHTLTMEGEDHDMPITHKRRVTEDETPLPEARALIRENDKSNAKIGLGPKTDMGLRGAFQGSKEDALFDQPQETDEEQPMDEAVPEEEEETETSTFQYPNLMVSDPLLDSRDVLGLPPDGKG